MRAKDHLKAVEANAAFTEAFELHYRRLCFYAREILHDHDAAEDLVQGCFVKLWARKDRFDVSNGLLAYLYTMVRNAAFDFLNRQKKLTGFEDISESVMTTFEEGPLIAAETMEYIYRLREELPQKTREVFTLLFVDGLDHRSAAEKLNITESTLRTLKARGISFIRQRLRLLPELCMLVSFISNL